MFKRLGRVLLFDVLVCCVTYGVLMISHQLGGQAAVNLAYYQLQEAMFSFILAVTGGGLLKIFISMARDTEASKGFRGFGIVLAVLAAVFMGFFIGRVLKIVVPAFLYVMKEGEKPEYLFRQVSVFSLSLAAGIALLILGGCKNIRLKWIKPQESDPVIKGTVVDRRRISYTLPNTDGAAGRDKTLKLAFRLNFRVTPKGGGYPVRVSATSGRAYEMRSLQIWKNSAQMQVAAGLLFVLVSVIGPVLCILGASAH